MSKQRIIIATACLVLLATVGIIAVPTLGQGEHDAAEQTTAPAPEARAVLEAARGYESWSKFPENQEPKVSEGHDDMYVLAFYNSVVGRAMAQSTTSLPDGSIIVKENRPEANAQAAALTIMAKRQGEWFWIKSTPDLQQVHVENGQPVAGKRMQGCTGCHAQAGTDMVFTHDFAR